VKTTLYKQNKDKIQVWTIEVEQDKYRSIEGFEGGAMTESKWTVAKPKNVGKKNETTGSVQATAEAAAKVLKKKEKGYVESKDLLKDYVPPFSVMLAHEYGKHKSKVAYPIWSQPKLDGMRCYITVEGMFSRQGKPIISAPHVFESVRGLFERNPKLVLDGELYNHELKDDFNTIISLVKKAKPTPDDLELSRKQIQFHTYDCYLGDSDVEVDFEERYRKLVELCEDLQYVRLVDTVKCSDWDELDGEYGMYLLEGYEGQMIRSNVPYQQKRTTALLKRKEFVDDEFEIVDVLEGVGNRSGMFGKFVLKTKQGVSFESNSRGNEEYYKEILLNRENYIGKQATIRYQNLTPKGVPRFPVCVGIRDYE
jgi:DNA ligase-1